MFQSMVKLSILPVAYCTFNLAWTALTAGYLQYSEGTLFLLMKLIGKRIWSRLAKLFVPLYEIGAMTRLLLSEHFDIGAAYAQYGSL